MNSVQDFIKDKTITVANGAVKTGKIIATTSSSAVKSAVSTATDITVRRAPGVLKSTDDLAGTAAKRAGVETVRGIRTANQIRHSVNNRKPPNKMTATKYTAARYQITLWGIIK